MHICLTLQIKVEVCFPFYKLAVTCFVHFSCVHCVTAPTCHILLVAKKNSLCGFLMCVCVFWLGFFFVLLSLFFNHFVPLLLGLVLVGVVSVTAISERAILLHLLRSSWSENRCSEHLNITYNVRLHRERGWQDQ